MTPTEKLADRIDAADDIYLVELPESGMRRERVRLSADECNLITSRLRASTDRAITVPDGWKLVPLSPTQAMSDAARQSWMNDQGPKASPLWGSEASDIYKAMLAAAPASTEPTSGACGCDWETGECQGAPLNCRAIGVPTIGMAPLTRENCLPRLRQAIIDNTRGEEMFWLGEILLAELEKETGFNGQQSPTSG